MIFETAPLHTQSPDKRKKRASENLMLFNNKSYDQESPLKINMTLIESIMIQLIFGNLTVIVT